MKGTRNLFMGVIAAVAGLSLIIAGCGGSEKAADKGPAPVRGKVHCGSVQRCTGESFLIYTKYGGKVIRVEPTEDRSREDVAKMLVDGAEVEIEGIENVYAHYHVVPADRIHFLSPEPSGDSGKRTEKKGGLWPSGRLEPKV